MELILSNGQRSVGVDSAAIRTAVHSLSDPGDFIILRDAALGEVRAAGPHNREFLLQYELTNSDGPVRGEVENVSADELISVLDHFQEGDTRWEVRYRDSSSGGARRVAGVILGVALVIAMVWIVSRAV